MVFVIASATAVRADQLAGEVALGVRSVTFKGMPGSAPLGSFEVGSRGDNAGLFLLLGKAEIGDTTYVTPTATYTETVDYIPVELNGKLFATWQNVEFGIGGGVSMNFLDYNRTDQATGNAVESRTEVLTGVQALAEVKFLFPATTGRDSFIAIEYEYQWVPRPETVLGGMDMRNYRVGLRLGGRW